MRRDAGDKCILLDACVLIDFLKEDSDVLVCVGQHIGTIVVPSPLLLEVKGITLNQCKDLGIRVVTPDMSLLEQAAVRLGGLSFNDRLCLSMSKELQAILCSNDRLLLTTASKAGVMTRWGLELLLLLAQVEVMSFRSAEEIATRICARSSRYSSALEEFKKALLWLSDFE